MKNLLFLFILVLISCSSPGNRSKDNDIEVKTILKYSDAIQGKKNFSELFDRVETILLDTTGNFLVSDVRQMKLALGSIFVLDNSESVYIFDKEGRGQTIINKKGQGAQEYLEIRGFDLTPDSLLCLLTFPLKLMYFTLEGDYVKETKLDLNGSELALLPNNKAAVYANSPQSTPKDNEMLLEICDQTDGTHQGYIPKYKCLKDVSLPTYQRGKTFTSTQNGERLFTQPLSNNIYAMDGRSMYIRYQIDFGAKTPPDDLSEPSANPYAVSEFIKEHFPVYGFNSSWENDSYFHVQVFIEGDLTTLLYDKKRQMLYSGYLNDDLTGCESRFIEANDQYLVGYCSADDIVGLANYLRSSGKGFSNMPPLFEKMMNHAEGIENPIVCLYHFK